MKKEYIFEYLNENDFKKQERAVKKYNMLAYKKLVFEYYPNLREGKFIGRLTSSTIEVENYELVLPTDELFAKVHGNICLHYSVYKDKKIVLLNNFTPSDILMEYNRNEFATYKGVMISKSHPEKDMFKINLLNMITSDNVSSANVYSSSTRNTFKKTKNTLKKPIQTSKEEINKEIENDIMAKREIFDEITNEIKKIIDNDIPSVNLTFFKKKFNDWIIVYLMKKEYSYSKISISFIDYIKKNTKDIVILHSIKILSNDIRYDYNVMTWLKELVDNKKIKIVMDSDDETIRYTTNLDKLTFNEQKVIDLKIEKHNWIIWIITLIIVIIFCLFANQKYNTSSVNYIDYLEDYLIEKELEDYNGDVYSEEAVQVYVNKLKEFKDNNLFYNAIDYIYYLGINDVFKNKDYVFNDDYYIVLGDNYYEWLLEKTKEEYPRNTEVEVINIKGKLWSDDQNSLGGILKLDDYKMEYMYTDTTSITTLEVSYYIYYKDTLVKNGKQKLSKYYAAETSLFDILKAYYNENIDFIYQSTLINFSLETKSIVFKNNNNNLKIVVSNPVFSGKYIRLD